MPSDEQLAQAASVDPAALTELYNRHVTRIYRYILARVGTTQDAQDLTAQTFTEMLHSLQRYRGDGVFAAWLTVIARNVVAGYYRKHRPELPIEAADETSSGWRIDDAVSQRLQLAAVQAGLAELSAEHAEVVRLRIFGELSTAETAQVMGRSEAAVKMLLRRALRDLRARLGEVER
ncbi:MAG: RNA polymerase sigma factor [Anaerolineae bacterium]|nr:RNA polymerase sigma factor [Anaerolineae bacterium]